MGLRKSKLTENKQYFDIFLDKYDRLKSKKISKIIEEFDGNGIHFIYYKFPNKNTLLYNTIRINSLYKWKHKNINKEIYIGNSVFKKIIINNKVYYEKELYNKFLTILIKYNSIKKPLFLSVSYPNIYMRHTSNKNKHIKL